MLRGDRIRERLDAINKSQADLARAIGVSPQAISKMTTGETTDTPKLYQIARFLETSPEYLNDETTDATPHEVQDRRLAFKGQEPDGEDLDAVFIDHADLRLGLGGTFLEQHVEVERRPFSRAWLRQFTDAAPANLAWAQGMGNSMEPTIGDGEVVLIDRGQKAVSFGDNVYAFAYGDVGMIKRLRPLPDGSMEIHSDNPNINLPPARAVDDELHVIGRVVAVVKRI